MYYNWVVKKNTSAFTIVELLVVIVVIGVLTAIGIMTYSNIQANARDHQRLSKVTVIAEALEKYYDKNGEYPSCNAMSALPAVISSTTLVGIDKTALTVPTAQAGTNSILPSCSDLPNGADNISYIGDGSATCMTQDCMQWTIKYRQETTGNTLTISSRRRVSVATLDSISNLSVSYIDFAQINLSWGAINNATSYTVQRATNNAFSNGLVQSNIANNTFSTAGLSSGTAYFFRVMPNSSVGSGSWSNVTSAITSQLSSPVTSVTSSGGNILATVSPLSCPNGETIQYGLRSRTNYGTWGSYSAWSTSNTASQVASQGVEYSYQAQARCYSTTSTSPTFTGAEGAYVYPISTIPATPSVVAVTSGGNTTYSWSAAACPAGTSAYYQYQYIIDYSGGYYSGWYSTGSPSVTLSTYSEGYQYTVQAEAQCYTSYYTGSFSGVGQASYIRPVQSPTNVSQTMSRQDSNSLAFTASATCTNGAYMFLRTGGIDVYLPSGWTWNGTSGGWYSDAHPGWATGAWAYYGNPYTAVVGGANVSGLIYYMRDEFSCQNYTTGRMSPSTGSIQVGPLYAP
jgi:type II secretory pathway pseudopilin PulG